MLFNILSLKTLCLSSFIFSFLFCVIGLKILINFFKKRDNFQPIRYDNPLSHLTKNKTPTMGGVVLSLAILSSSLLFANLNDKYTILILFVSLSFGFLGFIDDFLKITNKNDFGFRGSVKLVLQLVISSIAILYLEYLGLPSVKNQEVFIPFLDKNLYLGIFLIPFLVFVITGSANAVNITDGLDGLAIVPIMLCSVLLGFIAFLNIPSLQDNMIFLVNNIELSQISILCSAVIGTGFGFFVYNKYPAKIFMGDVGSLMYGGFLATTAIILGYEMIYALLGLIFIIEILSSTIQVFSHFFFGKKILKMAPLHHHFEKSGWSERKVIFIFWLFSFACFMLSIVAVLNN